MPARNNMLKELVKYAVVGICSNLVLYLAFVLLTNLGVGHKTAMTLLYLSGTFLTFILNRNWTFRHQGKYAAALPKYLITYFSGYVTNFCLLVLLVDKLHYDHRIIQFFLIFFVAAQLFVLQRTWVFRT